jgi:hypothetical protein
MITIVDCLQESHDCSTADIVNHVAAQYSILPRTLSHWLTERRHISEQVALGFGKRKRASGAGRKLLFADVVDEIVEYVRELQRALIPCHPNDVRKFALQLSQLYELDDEKFVASPSWMNGFLQRTKANSKLTKLVLTNNWQS